MEYKVAMISLAQKGWLERLNDQLFAYIHRLEFPAQTGRFLPCEMGTTQLGKSLSLGYSCFALKTYYMLGLWDELDRSKRTEWIRFIKSYQVEGMYGGDVLTTNAFIDPPLVDFHKPRYTFRQWLFKPSNRFTYQQAVIFAETKQALATLAEVGELPDVPYLGFMQSPEKLRAFLSSLDWRKPWGAGGQASAQAVFIKTQAPIALGDEKSHELVQVCNECFDEYADPSTGLYFSGNARPQYGEAINGAMKVLTGLDWLEAPVHYPEELINTCLSDMPSNEGCHLVDTVYVLYRCLQYTPHRKQEIQSCCANIFEMICKHYNKDGGFSYFVGGSQTKYYGAPIAKGLPESDIHGTILLIWALAMIVQIMEVDFLNWKVIRP